MADAAAVIEEERDDDVAAREERARHEQLLIGAVDIERQTNEVQSRVERQVNEHLAQALARVRDVGAPPVVGVGPSTVCSETIGYGPVQHINHHG